MLDPVDRTGAKRAVRLSDWNWETETADPKIGSSTRDAKVEMNAIAGLYVINAFGQHAGTKLL